MSQTIKKKVLLIAPLYHGYYIKLKNAFEKEGYDVILFSEEPTDFFSTNFYFSKIKNINYFWKSYLKKIQEVNNRILKTTYSIDLEYIVVIKGDLLTHDFYQQLKSSHSKSQMILYQWDSLNHFNYFDISKYFDKIYSFDSLDSKTYNFINYLPLFYSDEYEKLGLENYINYKYDVFFLGVNHSIRLRLLQEMMSIFDKNKMKYTINLMTDLTQKFKMVLSTTKINSFLTSRSFKEFADDYQRSKAILDITSPIQTGLPIRIIEAIGANKKIITTNYNIIYESFYSQDLVFLWGRDDLNRLPEFLNKTHAKIDSSVYSINSFVRRLIS